MLGIRWAVVETTPDDFKDMEEAILHSPASPSLDLLRPEFPAWRKQMVESGFPRVPRPMSSSGVQDDLATNMFLLLVKDAALEPELKRQRRADVADKHNLRNILSYMRVPMFRNRERWKP
jgi:hypothetical protein